MVDTTLDNFQEEHKRAEAAETELLVLKETIRQQLNGIRIMQEALLRVQPQIEGALCIQDVAYAIALGNRLINLRRTQ